MKVLRLAGESDSPLAREEELLRGLQAAGACCTDLLRLTIAGNRLFLDGFVPSLDQKLQAERICQELAQGNTVVNRLRVAAAEEGQVS